MFLLVFLFFLCYTTDKEVKPWKKRNVSCTTGNVSAVWNASFAISIPKKFATIAENVLIFRTSHPSGLQGFKRKSNKVPVGQIKPTGIFLRLGEVGAELLEINDGNGRIDDTSFLGV